MNTQLYSAPIHVAAEDVNIENIRLLLENPRNKADVNSNNKLGLTAIHILLSKLVEFAAWQNKTKNIRPNKVERHSSFISFHTFNANFIRCLTRRLTETSLIFLALSFSCANRESCGKFSWFFS